jgi:hypothetical protein
MKLRNLHFIALALLGMGSSGHGEPVEEIYIARSVREATMPPTEFCTKAKTGVDRASSEDKFTFRSMAARASDGRVTDTDAGTIGSAHSCGGLVADKPGISQFYGEFVLGGLAFKAIGECHLAKADFPERGLSTLFCAFNVSDLPADYVGGLVTTSTFYNYTYLVLSHRATPNPRLPPFDCGRSECSDPTGRRGQLGT